MDENQVNVIENDDGSATIEMELDDAQQEVLLSKGVSYLLILEMYKITEKELLEILKKHKGE